METDESFAGRISIKGKNLRTKLRVISSLLFIQPFLVVSYILYRENLFSTTEYLYLFFLALLVVLGGMVILRETFDKFIMVAGFMKKAEAGEMVVMEIQKDTSELREISLAFNKIVEKLQEASKKLDDQTEELRQTLAERDRAQSELGKLNGELERKIEERSRLLLDAQDELVRNEKLAMIGQLAGIVGHELRNPLGVINNALYYLKIMLPDADEKVLEYLNIIRNEVVYSQSTLSDLLEFSRIKKPRKSRVAVRELVSRSLLKCPILSNIEVQADTPERLEVSVDQFQAVQVFENLIMNAIQAMPEGGSLRIAARRVSSSEFQVLSSDLKPETSNLTPDGDFVEISVSDTGEGISPENMPKIFQPLFTTKARGIGIGLAVSKKLTEGNGGRLCLLDTAVGKGSTFVVILPVEEGEGNHPCPSLTKTKEGS